MYCRQCRYDLRRITTAACPECGAAFDTDDPKTFDPILPSGRIALVVLWTAFVALLFTQVSLATARGLVVDWPGALHWVPIALVPLGALAAGWFAERRAAFLLYGGLGLIIVLVPLNDLDHRLVEWMLMDVPITLSIALVTAVPCLLMLASWLAGRTGWRLHAAWHRTVLEGQRRRLARWTRRVAAGLAVVVVVATGYVVIETLRVLHGKPVITFDHGARLDALRGEAAGSGGLDARDAWQTLDDLLVQAEMILNGAAAEEGSVDFDHVIGGAAVPDDIEREKRALAALADAGILDVLDEIAAGPVPLRPWGNATALQLNLSYLSRARRLAKTRAASMRIALDRGDFEGVTRAFEHEMALARAMSRQGTLIDHLVAMAIVSLAARELQSELIEAELPAPVCRRLLLAIDRHPLASIEVAIETERILFHDTIQRSYTDDGTGDGYMIPGAVAAGVNTLAPTGYPSRFFAAFKARFWFESRRAELDLFDALTDASVREARQSAWARDPPGEEDDRHESLVSDGYVMVGAMSPGLSRFIHQGTLTQLEREGLRAAVAIELYAQRHGRPPSSLEALVPDILPALPIDPFSGEPLRYRGLEGDPHGRAFLLYSVGGDNTDDGGTFDERRPRLGATRNEPGLDLPLNPPRSEAGY